MFWREVFRRQVFRAAPVAVPGHGQLCPRCPRAAPGAGTALSPLSPCSTQGLAPASQWKWFLFPSPLQLQGGFFSLISGDSCHPKAIRAPIMRCCVSFPGCLLLPLPAMGCWVGGLELARLGSWGGRRVCSRSAWFLLALTPLQRFNQPSPEPLP